MGLGQNSTDRSISKWKSFKSLWCLSSQRCRLLMSIRLDNWDSCCGLLSNFKLIFDPFFRPLFIVIKLHLHIHKGVQLFHVVQHNQQNRLQSYLALVGVEVLRSLLLIVGDAFQRGTVVPVASVVVTQDAENTVSLQRTMTTHHQPPFSRWVALLWFEEQRDADLTSITSNSAEWGSKYKNNRYLLNTDLHYGKKKIKHNSWVLCQLRGHLYLIKQTTIIIQSGWSAAVQQKV